MGINDLSTGAKIGIAAGTAVIVGGIIGAAVASKRKKRKKITHTKRGLKQDRKRKSKQKWEVAYQKRKKAKSGKRGRSSKKIHYARKTGQPYILLANGQAKFIKGKRRKQ